jgi:hypothetical protein
MNCPSRPENIKRAKRLAPVFVPTSVGYSCVRPSRALRSLRIADVLEGVAHCVWRVLCSKKQTPAEVCDRPESSSAEHLLEIFGPGIVDYSYSYRQNTNVGTPKSKSTAM